MAEHVCHVINHLDAGGAEQYVVQLSNHLTRSGHRVSIVAGHPHLLAQRLEPAVSLYTIELHPGSARSAITYAGIMLSGIRKLVHLFRQQGVTIVHTHLAASALPAWVAAAICRLPVVHSKMYAGNIGSRYERWLFALRLPLALVTRFLVFTRYSADEVRQFWHVPTDKIVVSSIGVDTDRFYPSEQERANARQAWGLSPTDQVLLVVARLHPEKDVELAIRAARGLDDAGTILMIAGDGSQRQELEALVESLPGRTRVRFLGVLQDPRPAYAAADLLLQTSRAPNLGTAVLESMASGVPVLIAYRDKEEHKMAADTFDGLDIGWLSQATTQSIATCLANVFADPAKIARHRVAARAFVESRHARSVVYPAMSRTYDAIKSRA